MGCKPLPPVHRYDADRWQRAAERGRLVYEDAMRRNGESIGISVEELAATEERRALAKALLTAPDPEARELFQWALGRACADQPARKALPTKDRPPWTHRFVEACIAVSEWFERGGDWLYWNFVDELDTPTDSLGPH